MGVQVSVWTLMHGAVREQGGVGGQPAETEVAGDNGFRPAFFGQEPDDGRTIVFAARTPDFVKVSMQQLFESGGIASNAWVVEFGFQGLDFGEECGH